MIKLTFLYKNISQSLDTDKTYALVEQEWFFVGNLHSGEFYNC